MFLITNKQYTDKNIKDRPRPSYAPRKHCLPRHIRTGIHLFILESSHNILCEHIYVRICLEVSLSETLVLTFERVFHIEQPNGFCIVCRIVMCFVDRILKVLLFVLMVYAPGYCRAESIEEFIENQAFLLMWLLTQPLPPSPVSKLDR